MNRVRTAKQLAWSRCGWLTAATALLWLLLVGPAWFVAGRLGIIGVSWAAVLCVIPGWSVFWIAAAYATAGTQVSLVILAGTALRMVFVLVGMVALQSFDARLGYREFVVWLVVFYLGMLTVETYLVVLRPEQQNGQPA